MKLQNGLTAVLALSLSGSVWAANAKCVFKMMKNTCWDDYAATIYITKARTLQEIASGTVAKKERQTNITFDCPLGEPISLRATFTPAFWEGTAEKRYTTKRVWDIPLHLPEKTERWEISACFPDDFQSVPIPPTIGTGCHCEAPKDIKAEK